MGAPSYGPRPDTVHKGHWTAGSGMTADRRLPVAHMARLIAGIFLLMSAGAAGVASAATPTAGPESVLRYAGLVVRHGDGRVTYAYVPFEEEEINGIELLKRSGIPQVTISFGGLGEGVCSLEGEGCSASACRQRVCQGASSNAPFWQYFRQNAAGDWRPLTLGASATKVRNGDIDGWSWTGREAGLPAATLPQVARLAGAPLDGTEPGEARPYVRTVYPPGMVPPGREAEQGPLVYASAGGLLALIGGAALLAIRRRRLVVARP